MKPIRAWILWKLSRAAFAFLTARAWHAGQRPEAPTLTRYHGTRDGHPVHIYVVMGATNCAAMDNSASSGQVSAALARGEDGEQTFCTRTEGPKTKRL